MRGGRGEKMKKNKGRETEGRDMHRWVNE